MQKVVIVGGTGYIGSRVFHMLNQKHTVHTVDLEWFGNYINPENIKADYHSLSKDFWDNYDVIILFAGHSSVPMCENQMITSFDNNVVKFVDLLSKTPEKKLIYASSSSIYGNTMSHAAIETWDKFVPSNFYDLSKKIIDLYAQCCPNRTYGLRMGTVCGASPNLRVDIMINKMYHCAKTEKKITVFNPQVFRPILGMEDMCRAVEHLVENDLEPGIYNLASFNANIEQISNAVANAIQDVEIKNTGSAPTYDFSIDTTKFEKTGFHFTETVESIIDSLNNTYDGSNCGIRKDVNYAL